MGKYTEEIDSYQIDDSQILDTYVALDIEATGISPNKSRIIEIGAIKVIEGIAVERFSSLINPCVPLSEEISELTVMV